MVTRQMGYSDSRSVSSAALVRLSSRTRSDRFFQYSLVNMVMFCWRKERALRCVSSAFLRDVFRPELAG